jgi:hypothetical protein
MVGALGLPRGLMGNVVQLSPIWLRPGEGCVTILAVGFWGWSREVGEGDSSEW